MTAVWQADPSQCSPRCLPAAQPRGYAPITNTKDNPPCNTLFIGNLGDGVNEAEIRGLFRCGAAGQQGWCSERALLGRRARAGLRLVGVASS